MPVALDPQLSAVQNAEKRYARARRREDAVDLIAGGFAPDVVRERLQIKGPITELYRLLREAGRDDLVAVAELDHQSWKDQAA